MNGENIMRKLIFATLLAAASAGVGAQSTPSSSDEEKVTVSRPSSMRIEVPEHIRRFSSEEFQPYKATFDLSNGSTVTLSRVGLHMYAEIDALGRHEIVGTASNAFVALDKQLKLRIDLGGESGASGELLMVVPQAQVAGAAPAEPKYLQVAFR